MNSNQIKLLIIISIFMIPFIISYFMMDDYSSDKEWSTTNYGTFIEPIVSINDIKKAKEKEKICVKNNYKGC